MARLPPKRAFPDLFRVKLMSVVGDWWSAAWVRCSSRSGCSGSRGRVSRRCRRTYPSWPCVSLPSRSCVLSSHVSCSLGSAVRLRPVLPLYGTRRIHHGHVHHLLRQRHRIGTMSTLTAAGCELTASADGRPALGASGDLPRRRAVDVPQAGRPVGTQRFWLPRARGHADSLAVLRARSALFHTAQRDAQCFSV